MKALANIKSIKNFVLTILAVILLLIIWQYFSDTYKIVRLLASSPKETYYYFVNDGVSLLKATGMTLFEAVMGLLIAMFFSFSLMILGFYKPKFIDFLLPLMITSQVIPLIVLAPLFILLFGIGVKSKIAMTTLMSFFPIFVNFAVGYKSISSDILNTLYVYNANTTFKIFRVYFPLSMPSIMAGLKISATLAVIGAIVSEFTIGAKIGLGKNVFICAKKLMPEVMMCSLIMAILLGMVIYGLIYLIERKFGKWYVTQKEHNGF